MNLIWWKSHQEKKKQKQLICSAAQADCYSLVWHRARQKSGVHPAGGEGLGAELSQALQGPHLQQAQHGKKHKASSSLIRKFVL